MQAQHLFTVTHLSVDRDSNTEVNAALQLVFFTSCLAASLWKHRVHSSCIQQPPTSSRTQSSGDNRSWELNPPSLPPPPHRAYSLQHGATPGGPVGVLGQPYS